MSPEKAAQHPDPAVRALDWMRKNQRRLTWLGGAVVAAALLVWFAMTYRQNKERAAMDALDAARTAVLTGNLPLAASDLSRVVGSYRGTLAADEATILLGQTRLRQEQPGLAAQELQTSIGQGVSDQFRAQAYGLLGTALEEIGDHAQAGQAYENAAAAAWYDFLTAEYLNDAGRAYTAAGDSAKAIELYRTVVTDYGDTQGAAEARVRLAELEAASGLS